MASCGESLSAATMEGMGSGAALTPRGWIGGLVLVVSTGAQSMASCGETLSAATIEGLCWS